MEERKEKRKGRFLGLWIASGIFFAIALAVTLYFQITVSGLLSTGEAGDAIGAAVILIVMIALNLVPCGVTVILSFIGLMLTIFKRPNGLRVGQLIYFLALTILPIVLFFSFNLLKLL